MPDAKKSEVKWEIAPGFKEAWKHYSKLYPSIKEAMTEFNKCKRDTPPRQLPKKMKDHKLGGPLKEFMDCHLDEDVILIYKNKSGGAIKLLLICQHKDLEGPRAKDLAKRLAKA